MSPRSEQYLANAEKCQQCTDVAYTSGTKRLYEVLASQWRQLADAIRKLGEALEGEEGFTTKSSLEQRSI